MRWSARGSVSLFVALALPLSLRGQSFPEYEAKAALLYQVASFVDWPGDALSVADSSFTIGVYGRDPFEAYIDALEGRTVRGRPVRIRRFTDLEDLTETHILFIGAFEREQVIRVLGLVAGMPVLTVGEGEDFAELGGIIRWYVRDDRLRLEVNRCAAERAGLRISSRLLRVATLTPEDCPMRGRVR